MGIEKTERREREECMVKTGTRVGKEEKTESERI